MTDDLLETLKRTLDEAEWSLLRTHAEERDALILVELGLDLLEVAVAVASNRSVQVEEWIQAGRIGKPTAKQLQEIPPTRKFLCVIVQPFVLAQELILH